MWFPFHPLSLQAEWVLSLPASVRLSVRQPVRKLSVVSTITHHRFELESPNLLQTCTLRYSQLVLKMGVIDCDLQGHFGHFVLEFLQIWLVCMITYNGFELESPNLHQICILGYSQLVLKMEVINFDLQHHLASFRLKKLHSMLLLFTELRGATCPKHALVSFCSIFGHSLLFLPLVLEFESVSKLSFGYTIFKYGNTVW